MARGSGAGPAGRHGAELHDVQRLDFDKSCGVSLMMNSKEILGRACKWRPSSVYRYDTHSPTKEVKWPAVRARAVNVGRNAGRSVGKRARSGGRKKPAISQSAGGCWGVAAGPKCASGTEKHSMMCRESRKGPALSVQRRVRWLSRVSASSAA